MASKRVLKKIIELYKIKIIAGHPSIEAKHLEVFFKPDNILLLAISHKTFGKEFVYLMKDENQNHLDEYYLCRWKFLQNNEEQSIEAFRGPVFDIPQNFLAETLKYEESKNIFTDPEIFGAIMFHTLLFSTGLVYTNLFPVLYYIVCVRNHMSTWIHVLLTYYAPHNFFQTVSAIGAHVMRVFTMLGNLRVLNWGYLWLFRTIVALDMVVQRGRNQGVVIYLMACLGYYGLMVSPLVISIFIMWGIALLVKGTCILSVSIVFLFVSTVSYAFFISYRKRDKVESIFAVRNADIFLVKGFAIVALTMIFGYNANKWFVLFLHIMTVFEEILRAVRNNQGMCSAYSIIASAIINIFDENFWVFCATKIKSILKFLFLDM
jgi:hypothetical protein